MRNLIRLVFVGTIVALLTTQAVNAKVGPHLHRVSFQTLQLQTWAKSANVRRGAWVVTDLRLDGFSLHVKQKFSNDKKYRGYTGCTKLIVYGKNNLVLSTLNTKVGVKPALTGGVKNRQIDRTISLIDEMEVGIDHISLLQWHCPTGRFKDEAKQIYKVFEMIIEALKKQDEEE